MATPRYRYYLICCTLHWCSAAAVMLLVLMPLLLYSQYQGYTQKNTKDPKAQRTEIEETEEHPESKRPKSPESDRIGNWKSEIRKWMCLWYLVESNKIDR